MQILLVNNTVIPVKEYGGTERIIWWLGKELNRLGHQVSYLVAPGSSCPFAKVYALDPLKSINEQIPENIDVVHVHFPVKEEIRKPYLITFHGNYHEDDLFDINNVFVSRNHAQRNSSSIYVNNGIDPDDYGPVDFNVKRKYLLFLGYAKRPEKNLNDCITIARKTKNTLAVAGGKFKWFKWRPWVDYKGFVGGSVKNRILQDSKALLFPIRWHEPFGLSILESLYFGSPVIGSRYGSLPDLIKEDIGFLSNSIADMVEAVNHLERFDPKHIHQYVCENYSSNKMAQNYLKLYEKVLSGQSLNVKRPVNGGNFSNKELLPLDQ